jgi:hypothetical protein
LSKSVPVKVFDIFKDQLGAVGRCWIVKAKVVDGEFAGEVIELPSCIGKEPNWVEPIWVHKTKSDLRGLVWVIFSLSGQRWQKISDDF